MRLLNLWSIAVVIMFVGSACAETTPPMKLDAPLDSLLYSTTEWSEPVNGLQMRVTYPMEIYFGEPLELKVEVKCDSRYEAPIRVRRQVFFDPKKVMLSLIGRDSSGYESLYDCQRLGTDSVPCQCFSAFQTNLKSEKPSVTVIFQRVSGVELKGGLGSEQHPRTVARQKGLSPGMHTLSVALERHGAWEEKIPLAASARFMIFAHPYVPLVRRLVVIVPRSYKLTDSCDLFLDKPETLSVNCDYYSFLYRTGRLESVYGMSDLDRDTVSLMGWPGSYSVMRFDDSLGYERAGHLDSIKICLFEATGLLGHMGLVSGKSTLLLGRTVLLKLTEEERLRIIRCGGLRVHIP